MKRNHDFSYMRRISLIPSLLSFIRPLAFVLSLARTMNRSHELSYLINLVDVFLYLEIYSVFSAYFFCLNVNVQ